MRIIHLCLSNFYVDGMGYQENLLVRQHVRDGHDVLVIASTETYGDEQRLIYTSPGDYAGGDGARVVRLPYVKWLPHFAGRKFRFHAKVYDLIENFCPDSILFHGAAGNELVTIARYVRDHPKVRFYVDSHEDFNNSAKNFVSREILHRIFYRHRLQRALPQIRKILCISHETIEFVSDVYGVGREYLEFYPLGGFPVSQDEWSARRSRRRVAMDLHDGLIVILQSGKQTAKKKLIESLDALYSVENPQLRMLIAGTLHEDMKSEAEWRIARDPRVTFLGWQSTEDLTDLLCAADVYLQPGTQSATMQHALCCGCPVLIDDVPAHGVYQQGGAVILNEHLSLRDAIAGLPGWDFSEKREQARQFAGEVLDYSVLAQRVLQD